MDEVSCVGDIIIKMIGIDTDIDTDIDLCCMRRAIMRNVSLRSLFQKVKWGTWRSLWKGGGRTGLGVGGEIFRGYLFSAILQTQRGLRLTNLPSGALLCSLRFFIGQAG